jgi:hypothetical protein
VDAANAQVTTIPLSRISAVEPLRDLSRDAGLSRIRP